MRKIDQIIIHCSATPEGRNVTVADIDRWHRARGFLGIGYTGDRKGMQTACKRSLTAEGCVLCGKDGSYLWQNFHSRAEDTLGKLQQRRKSEF